MKDIRNCNTSSFHIQLLSKIMDMDQYPFIKLIIIKNISENEHEDLIQFLNQLDETYQQQKEEGLLDFTSLLVRFAGMLNEKLDPNETISALKKEGYYPSLMTEFTKLISNESKYRRK